MRPFANRDTPAHRAAQQFRKGTNFGNFLEVPPGHDWGAEHTLADVERLKNEGFDHIRLPIAWHHHTGPGPDFKIPPELLARVDAFVQAAVRKKLGVIINVHHFDAFTSDPVGLDSKLIAIWLQLAEHYRSQPQRVAFEVLNEPKDAATAEVMNALYARVIPVIRKTNPGRTIFVGPAQFNRVAELPNLRLPHDDNLIVTVHNYEPFEFTHQGASWGGPHIDLYRGVEFPGPPRKPLVPPTRNAIPPQVQDWITAYNTQPGDANPCSPATLQRIVDVAREWSECSGRPIHMGEFGVLKTANPESRANYYREFRTRLEQAGIGWAVWDWRAGFRYWDTQHNRPEPGMRAALFGNLVAPGEKCGLEATREEVGV